MAVKRTWLITALRTWGAAAVFVCAASTNPARALSFSQSSGAVRDVEQQLCGLALPESHTADELPSPDPRPGRDPGRRRTWVHGE